MHFTAKLHVKVLNKGLTFSRLVSSIAVANQRTNFLLTGWFHCTIFWLRSNRSANPHM